MSWELQVLQRNMQVAPPEWLDQLVTERVVALVESQCMSNTTSFGVEPSVTPPAEKGKQPEAPWLGRLWSLIVRFPSRGAMMRQLPRDATE
jgi:hypothetical protein